MSPARESIKQIQRSAQRAEELTKQMLAYSGRGHFIVKPVDLTEMTRNLERPLRAAIPKRIALRFDLNAGLPPVNADMAQAQQIVTNLLSNASDAIGENVGEIVVKTGVMRCDREYFREAGLGEPLAPGEYVYIEVGDTGCGMDAKTLERMFDPFFTTKFTGRGLGLAAVLGIVRGHHGAIKVTSALGQGTTFRILFPPCAAPVPAPPPPGDSAAQWKGEGTILVVDDEEMIRNLSRKVLERAGFQVLLAANGAEGVEVFREHANRIAAVLLDMTMPGMNGRDAFAAMSAIREDVCVILTSGYSEEEAFRQFGNTGLAGFVQKPYQGKQLIAMLRNLLTASDTA
jgi:CheY-like chemotaxis protein